MVLNPKTINPNPYQLGRVEGDVLQDALDDREQPPSADVVHRRVHLFRDPGHLRVLTGCQT